MQKESFLNQLTWEEVQARFGLELFEESCRESYSTMKRIQQAFQNPSCWNCHWAAIGEDMSVGIWPHIEDCLCPRMTEEQLDEMFCRDSFDEGWEEEAAHQCGYWQPNWDCFVMRW